MAVTASQSAGQTAAKFTADTYPVHIFGEDTNDSITVEGSTLTCKRITFTSDIAGSSTQLTITPIYSECVKNGTEPATVTMNGCDFLFTAGTATIDIAHGTQHIQCPPGKVIEIHVYENASKHQNFESKCTTTIGSQTLDGSITYTSDTLAKDFTAGGSPTGVEQLHGQCSFGFTLNVKFTYHLGITLAGTGGKAIHVA